MENNRLLIVSNRLPFQIGEKNGKFTLTQSAGGLVSSMISYFDKTKLENPRAVSKKAQWVGVSGLTDSKFINVTEAKMKEILDFDLHSVELTEIIQDKFYNGFCNNTIWPLFHYFPSYAKFNDDYYEHYEKANQLFCDKIVQIYQPGDVIWIHDYHLMLLPDMLRKILPHATIGFFLHIPFPSFELFRLIPSKWKRNILNGLLGADLVAFHTNDYMQHFLKSVHQILGYDISLRKIMLADRSVIADAIPVGIDFNKFYSSSNLAEVYEEKNSIKKTANGKQLVISIDRLDYAKALTNRLEAFDLFLNNYPEFRGKVSYILIVVPSRDIITKYKENKREIERLVSSINGRYGNIEWTPIVYQYKSIAFYKLAALYFACDVALITPLRDGMNLVAKEFISTRLDKRGVLILSETAGAASELAEALIVNPTDLKQIADAIFKALTMRAEEQVARNEIMQSRIKNHDVVKWVEDFISQLSIHKIAQEKLKVKEVNKIIEAEIAGRYEEAKKKRLVLLDYDGTLTPIVRSPGLAKPSAEVLELLRSLGENEKNDVVLISGRTRDCLDDWFREPSIGLVAEHGGFYKAPGMSWVQAPNAGSEWKKEVRGVFDFYHSRCYGSFIEEKELALAWHYRNAEKEMGFIRSRELLNELRELSFDLDFQVLEGSMVVEVRSTGINKGIWAKLFEEKNSYDFVLAIGDDKTDEDMFKALNKTAFTIKVGLVQSHARFNFQKQENVTKLLNELINSPLNIVEKQLQSV